MSNTDYYGGGGGGASRPLDNNTPYMDNSYNYRPTAEPESPYGDGYNNHGSPYSMQGAVPLQNMNTSYNGGAEGYNGVSYNTSADTIPAKHSDPYGDNVPLTDPSFSSPSGHSSKHPKSSHQPYPIVKERQSRWKKYLGAWVSYGLFVIQLGVFIGELIKNAQLHGGNPIATKPFNPMIGPSQYVLINMGARFVPCMANIPNLTDEIENWPCPNTQGTSAKDYKCTLNELCGMSGVGKDSAGKWAPHQWYRFIVPIFLHGGVIHIAFNMLLQLRLGADMERIIGSIRYFFVYFASGIFGFVLGGNFAPNGVASMGASGSLFGIIALVLLDLIYTWKERRSPGKELAILGVEIVFSFALGLLPGLDNFSHIGGFFMGLFLGMAVMHSPEVLRKKTGEMDPPYQSVSAGGKHVAFYKDPAGFFKGRKPLWWVWWIVRAIMLTLVIVAFALLLNNFYGARKECKNCKFLSCINVLDWCDVGNLKVVQVPKDDAAKVSANPQKRALDMLAGRMVAGFA